MLRNASKKYSETAWEKDKFFLSNYWILSPVPEVGWVGWSSRALIICGQDAEFASGGNHVLSGENLRWSLGVRESK